MSDKRHVISLKNHIFLSFFPYIDNEVSNEKCFFSVYFAEFLQGYDFISQQETFRHLLYDLGKYKRFPLIFLHQLRLFRCFVKYKPDFSMKTAFSCEETPVYDSALSKNFYFVYSSRSTLLL